MLDTSISGDSNSIIALISLNVLNDVISSTLISSSRILFFSKRFVRIVPLSNADQGVNQCCPLRKTIFEKEGFFTVYEPPTHLKLIYHGKLN